MAETYGGYDHLVGLIRITGAPEGCGRHARAFRNKEVLCVYRDGLQYYVYMEHAILALRSKPKKSKSARHYQAKIDKALPNQLMVIFNALYVEEVALVKTKEEYDRCCKNQVN